MGYVIGMPGHHCRAIYDPKSRSFLALSSVLVNDDVYQAELSSIHWHQWEPMVVQHYSRPKGCALVPADLYDHASAPLILEANGITGSSSIRVDHVESPNTHLLSYPYEEVQEASVYAALLNYQFSYVVPTMDSLLHFHVNIDSIFISIIQNRQLVFSNIFSFSSKEDILYYIAATAEQFQFDLKQQQVTYSGFLRPKTQLNTLLAKYLPKLKAMSLPDDIAFDTAFNSVAQHFYGDVFILPLCG